MIFISYRSYDYAAASQVRGVLTQHGVECWMAPESIPPGMDYGKWIPDAIDRCDVFVLILSKNTYDSIWVPKELDSAMSIGKRIIPIKMDASKLSNDFAWKLINVQIISAHNRFDEACKELLRAIGCVPDKNHSEHSESAKAIPPCSPAQQKKQKRKFTIDDLLFAFALCMIVFIMLCVKTPAEWFEENRSWLAGLFVNTENTAMPSADAASAALNTVAPMLSKARQEDDDGQNQIKLSCTYQECGPVIQWNEVPDALFYECSIFSVGTGEELHRITTTSNELEPYPLGLSNSACEVQVGAYNAEGCLSSDKMLIRGNVHEYMLALKSVPVSEELHELWFPLELMCIKCGYVIDGNRVEYDLHTFDASEKCTLCGYQKGETVP